MQFPEDDRRAPSIRTLTEADIEAISAAFHRSCMFTEKERVALEALSKIDTNVLRTLANAYTDATNNLWKGIIALAIIGALFFAIVGAGVKFPGKF